MSSFLNTLLGLDAPMLPRITCAREEWKTGTQELARRTLGAKRESGAYLLGRTHENGVHEILDFIYYDDVDPAALSTGIVSIRATALPKLWAICRARGYGVVADVHVHPFGFQQSKSDREGPVMPRTGHIAFILPNFAQGSAEPGAFGMYEYLGKADWRDHSRRGREFFELR